ncbi:hypothetical protein [Nocardioides sp. TF02-7]|uniref:hypothetical protein n=1 Tax=Nocardioides sp. TF02-7 TaxID=2917724 RepID=UPI001F06F39C|nr:hypothetical protein [Nocardioides sp. TF02-7]UMG91630.1 hypothetical protein MF408_16235 [Nocardioides sp. TF02-7]
MGVVEELVRARETYERGDWAAAYEAWSGTPPDAMNAADLGALATTAFLLGRTDDSISALQRAFRLEVAAGEPTAAVRSAFHLAMANVTAGAPTVAAGWTAQAVRLLGELDRDVVERGYVEFLLMFRDIGDGDWDAAAARAAVAADHARRHGDLDLLSVALAALGRTTLQGGRVPDGLRLFDEAMTVIAPGEGVTGDGRARLLRDDRGLPGGVGPRPGIGVDRRAQPLVQQPTGPGRVHGTVRGPPRPDHAPARRVRRGRHRVRRRGAALPGGGDPGRRWSRPGRAWRRAAAARRPRRRGGEL